MHAPRNKTRRKHELSRKIVDFIRRRHCRPLLRSGGGRVAAE
jgi:hypothetical protein